MKLIYVEKQKNCFQKNFDSHLQGSGYLSKVDLTDLNIAKKDSVSTSTQLEKKILPRKKEVETKIKTTLAKIDTNSCVAPYSRALCRHRFLVSLS